MISQTAEYALRAVTFLADHTAAQTAEAIAKGTKVPVGYLAKILQGLVRSGLVTSQRGLYGGFVLARPPKELSIHDVVQAVAPLLRIERCPLGIAGHGTNLCPLHRSLDNAMATVEQAFRRLTIHALLNQTHGSHPLCSFPHPEVPA
jgi:Rrf2 family nitric oxide-sensitive transcriptional repressor